MASENNQVRQATGNFQVTFDCEGYDQQRDSIKSVGPDTSTVYSLQDDERQHDIYQGEPLYTAVNPSTRETVRTATAGSLSGDNTHLTTVRSNVSGLSLDPEEMVRVKQATDLACSCTGTNTPATRAKISLRLKKQILKSKLKFVGLSLGNKPIPSRIGGVRGKKVSEQASLNAVRAGVMTVKVDDRVCAGDTLCIDLPENPYFGSKDEGVKPAKFVKGGNGKQRMADGVPEKQRLVVKRDTHESAYSNWNCETFCMDRMVVIAAMYCSGKSDDNGGVSRASALCMTSQFPDTEWIVRCVLLFLMESRTFDATWCNGKNAGNALVIIETLRNNNVGGGVSKAQKCVNAICDGLAMRKSLNGVSGSLIKEATGVEAVQIMDAVGDCFRMVLCADLWRKFYQQLYPALGMTHAIQRSQQSWTLGRCTRNAEAGQNTEVIFSTV